MIFFRPILYSLFIYLTIIPGLANDTDEGQNDKNIVSPPLHKQVVIELDDNAQEISGLQTIIVKPTDFHPEFIAYGKAISVKPLLDIRRQYLLASTQHHSAEVKYNITQKNLTRLQNLHKNEAVSTRKLQETQAQWQSDKASLNIFSLQRQMILSACRLQWGNTLTDWFTQPVSPQADNIITHRTQLLQITLPAGRQLPKGIETINIAANGHRKNATLAHFIAAAPQIDPFSQGPSYFFLSSNAVIQPGMNITAWIPGQQKKQHGIIIPHSSLLWHLGQAFIFVKLSDDLFNHRNIDHYAETPDGYFITTGIKEGEEVVSHGAQMLLSHEFRSQIPDEDDD